MKKKFLWCVDKNRWMSWNLTVGWYGNTFRRKCSINEFSSSHTFTFQCVSLPIDIRLLHKCLLKNETFVSLIDFKPTCSAVRVLQLIFWRNTDNFGHLNLKCYFTAGTQTFFVVLDLWSCHCCYVVVHQWMTLGFVLSGMSDCCLYFNVSARTFFGVWYLDLTLWFCKNSFEWVSRMFDTVLQRI